MCVQIEGTEDLEAIAAHFHARRTMDELSSEVVRPTDRAPAIVFAEDQRRLGWMRWGFQVPDRKRDGKLKLELHARGETAVDKPLWAESFARRRCAIATTGWWEVEPTPSGRGRGIPYYFSAGRPIVLAAIWRREDSGPRFSLVTMDAQREHFAINDRNPTLLNEESLQKWLDPRTQLPELTAISITRSVPVRAHRCVVLGDPSPA